MRKFASLFSVLMLLCTLAFAQTRTVKGVIRDDKGAPIPFATVSEAGTKNATIADAEGAFLIKIKEGSKLTITATGFSPGTATPGAGDLQVSLTKMAGDLQEVVVTTALGVSRTKRSLGYAAQEIVGEKLSQTKQQDLNTALAGKVAGVQILGGSGAKFGTSSLRIRGINSIDGSKSPLFVVDGVVTGSTDVNTDDVASLTVLKGPAATSIYGQRGEYGVIVITSKKGTRNKGVGIDFNQSTTFEKVYTLPEYQNEYGGGYSQDFYTFHFNPATMDPALSVMEGAKYYDYYADESWGHKLDGSLYAPWYAWDKSDPEFLKLKPLVPQPDNVRDFYETGITYNTNVAISKAGENYNTRFSYTNIDRTGITPNTGQKKNYLSLYASVNPFSKLTISTNINANFKKSKNIPDEGYGTQTAGSFNQWFQRNVEIDKLKRYKRPDGTFTSWNINGPTNSAPKYWDNPYTEAYENLKNSNDLTIFGNLAASYKITNNLKAGFVARGNFYSYYNDDRTASGTLVLASFGTRQYRSRENNYVWNLDYDKTFGNLSFRAAAYGEIRNNHDEDVREATVGGLTIPGFYNIAASKDRPTVSNTTTDKKVRSIYGYTSFGFKNMLFLDLNVRNDWSSALPVKNNSYLYGGVSSSFVFTELMRNRHILSFGKIRGSVGRTGSDLDPLLIHQVFTPNGLYGSTPTMTTPNQIPNEELKPALSTSYEAGTELRFLNDRIRFDFNYYNRKTTDQIISLTIPSSTGFSSALVNAGEIQNYGFEFTLGGTPIKRNIIWDVDANLGINKNTINELYPGINNFVWASFGFQGSPQITANRQVDQAFGTLIGQGFKRNASGSILIDDNGFPLTQDNVNLGSFLPKFTGGFTTSISYKSFHAGFSLDFQYGGKLMSITRMFNAGSGLSAETAGLNENGKPKRDDPSTGGGVLFPGVVESTNKANDIYVSAQDLYEGHLFSLWENWVFDATYVKLREVSIGYDLPSRWMSKIGVQKGSFSIISQNPWLIYTAVKGIDPSQLETDWREGGQLPGTRSLGVNLKLTF